MIPPCAQSLLACSGGPRDSRATPAPARAMWTAYAEPASPAPRTTQSAAWTFIAGSPGLGHGEHAIERAQGPTPHVFIELDDLIRSWRLERLPDFLQRVELHIRAQAASANETLLRILHLEAS